METVLQDLIRSLNMENGSTALQAFLDISGRELETAQEAVKRLGADLVGRHPEFKKWVDRDIENFDLVIPDPAPVVLYNGVEEAGVLGSWRSQLLTNLLMLDAECHNDQDAMKKLRFIWGEDWRTERVEFSVALQSRACLAESIKLARLLTSESDVQRVSPGETLFHDDFSNGLSGWLQVGDKGTFEVSESRLRMAATSMMAWTKTDPFPDGSVVSVEFTPHAGDGGVIFSFPANPVHGLDFSVSARSSMHANVPYGNSSGMEAYNHGISAYHVSTFCVGRNTTHLRRVGAGLKMLSHVTPDVCTVYGRAYRIEIIKIENTYQFLVDGKVIHAYVDAGVYGPVLSGGHLGFKLFPRRESTVDVYFGNVSVHRLK